MSRHSAAWLIAELVDLIAMHEDCCEEAGLVRGCTMWIELDSIVSYYKFLGGLQNVSGQ